MTTGKRGYNLRDGGSGGSHSEQTKAKIGAKAKMRTHTVSVEARKRIGAAKRGNTYRRKAVVVTLLDTCEEIHSPSQAEAAKKMGVSANLISQIATKRIKKSESKSGKYAQRFFAVRFRD